MVTPKQYILYLGALALIYDYATRAPTDSIGQGIIADIGATFSGGNMQTSQAGLDAIRSREGYSNTVYTDTAGYSTAGIGHKLTAADNIFLGASIISDSQIQAWFSKDISHAENLVNYYVTTALNQNQFDALVSMTFNIGGQLWKNADGSSTGINRALASGDMSAAASQIMRWVYPASVSTRRQSEQVQFTS